MGSLSRHFTRLFAGQAVRGVLVILVPSAALCGEHSGDVWGTWARTDSPHVITGEVRVPPSQTLTIEPGCQVLFRGYYKLIVDSAAVLQAVGTETDSLLFDVETPGTYWHGVRFLKADSASTISYARLQHGRALMGPPYQDEKGGAVYCNYSSPTLSHNIFTGNWSYGGGGAVYCDTGSHATIVSNLFYADTAWGYGGGAIYSVMSNPTIVGNTFDSILGRSGGGVIHVLDYSPTITNNIFTSNAGGEGAIYCEANPAYPYYPVISNNLFSGNHGGYAGAFGCNGAQATLTSNIFVGNQGGLGGAIMVGNGGTVSLARCVFVGNYAPGTCGYGGAIYAYDGLASVENCTFTANRADAKGGALAALSQSDFTIKNTVFWGDSAGTGPELYVVATSRAYVTYSDVQGGWKGVGNLALDPQFVAAPDSVQIGVGSPCIDGGDPDSPLDPDSTRADMGAYYYDQGTGPSRRIGSIGLPGTREPFREHLPGR